jgi:hypothetical protein
MPPSTPAPRDAEGVVPGGLVDVFKVVDSEWEHIEEREYSNTVVGTNAATIRVVGGTISITINGEEVLNWTDSDPILDGGIGVGAIWECEVWFDDIVVQSAG